jgi:hypothetical protein
MICRLTSFADNVLLSPWTKLRTIGKRFGTLITDLAAGLLSAVLMRRL